VHLVDLSDPSSIADRVATIRAEIEAYSADLGGRPWTLVGTKLDAVAEPEVASLAAELAAIAATEGVRWTMVSAVSGRELKQLLHEMFELAGERA
jgi:GTPase involved in cell partitioning and DNA repair